MRIVELATLRSGLVRVAATARLHPREIAAIAHDCAAAVVCTDADVVDPVINALRDASLTVPVLGFSDAGGGITPAALLATDTPGPEWRSPAPDDTAMLLYSSGTTGAPKGAQVTHRSWHAQCELVLEQLPDIGPEDTVLAVAPMAHFGGSMSLICAASGARTITLPTFAAEAVLTTVVTENVTVLPLAPIMLTRLTAESPQLVEAAARVLRVIPYGGSPITPSALSLAARMFPGTLCQFYGLAETLSPLTCLRPSDHDTALESPAAESSKILSSAGRVTSGTELYLRGDAEEDVTSSADALDPGEIMVRSPMVMKGYWGKPDLTRRMLDRSGWFATGDLGWIDDIGYLHLVDRLNDVIVTGGFNVHPSEVERVIGLLGDVAEVAVVGVPSAQWGESVHAQVVLTHHEPALDHDELFTMIDLICREHLAAYKVPRGIEIVPTIPRTALGKIDRRRIRAGSRHQLPTD